MKQEIISTSALAVLFGCSKETISQLDHKDVISKIERGKWDRNKCTTEYIAHLRKGASGQPTGSLEEERTRLAAAQADKIELEISVKQGELIDTGQAFEAWATVVQGCRAKLLALPTKLAPVVGAPDIEECRAKIEDGIHEALRELANPDLKELAKLDKGSDSSNTKPISAAAEVVDKRVGRRKAAVKRGGKRGTGKVGH